jgi:hypothetical protein
MFFIAAMLIVLSLALDVNVLRVGTVPLRKLDQAIVIVCLLCSSTEFDHGTEKKEEDSERRSTFP